MSELAFKVGRRVYVPSKEAYGKIAYIGFPNFASGKWIGVVLEEAKGKNDGSVHGTAYFQCEKNYGIFMKQTQLALLDDAGNPIEMPSPATPPDDGAMAAPKSRSRLSSSRISLAGSRQSLAGSRQSLAGSRTQLASPMVDKNTQERSATPTTTNTGEGLAAQTPKRASFIETGFVETLKPQFTPGQSMISPGMSASATVEEKLTNLQYQQEIDNLRSQVRDLNEKLETLRLKRGEDKDKLKDYDKTKLQMEQLIEFKSKIMESQASLQRDLQRAKQEAREAIEAKEQHADEMADLAETVEMATLDKEMAEEKAETLQIELETAKEKIEEMTLDLEILKAEMQQRESGTVKEGGASSYELKQLEQQNTRLRDTLVRMRDFSAHEKHEFQKLQKDLDQKKSEIAELGRTKEKLSARVEEMEQQIADLQEQVDAALGAEEMVEQLSDRKMALEDEVKLLKEELIELEALQDMNEQLVESNAELEQDLREELDLANAATREAKREKEAAFETIADREQTITKFRELVQKLQDQCHELQHRLETESTKPVSALPEILDFKKMFAETKAHTKAIDLELRKIEIQQATEHVRYLTAYMPDIFMNRGGDHDALLVLLLLPRLLWKSEILLTQIRDKFPSVEKVDRDGIVKGHAISQFTFRSRLAHYLYTLQTILHKYLYSLNTCKPVTLLKVGATYPEMVAQEKSIDNLIELLKKDQLDENVPTDMLDRCVNYFNTMYPVLLIEDGQLNHNQLLIDNVKALGAAFDSITIDATAIRTLIPTSPEIGDMGLLAQHVISTVEQIQQQLKLVRRRIPPDSSITNLGFKKEVAENLQLCCNQASKITRTLQETVKAAVQHILVAGEPDMTIPHDKLKEFAATASDKIYEQDDLGPVQSLKNSLATLLTNVTNVAQILQENEYDINVGTHATEKPIPPVVLRAQAVKKELEETKNLTNKLEKRDADIKELKKLIKQKQEELSEMTIRKELAEKKLGNVNKDYELTIDKLQRKLDEAQNALKRKEKEFEETMDHLQADIDSLENEKGELKEKLKLYNKKVLLEGMKSPSGGNAPSSLTSSQTGNGPSLPIIIKDSPLLMQEIRNLNQALKHETNERRKYQTAYLKKILDNLPPIPVVKKSKSSVLVDLQKESESIKKDLINVWAFPKVVDLTTRKPGTRPLLENDSPVNHLWRESHRFDDLSVRANNLLNRVVAESVKRKTGGKVEADFAVFPSAEMSKALNETKPIHVAEISIPIKKLDLPKSAIVPLLVTPNSLRLIQKQLAM